jgi:hypothetical protein
MLKAVRDLLHVWTLVPADMGILLGIQFVNATLGW